MKATQKLHEMGQSLWLDNITRGLLTGGTLRRYIQEFSITGLTSNPTIFDHAIKNSHDVAIHGRSCIPTTTNGAHPHAGQPALVGWYNRPLPRHHPAGVLTLPPAITAPTRRCRYGLPGSAEPCTRCRPGTPGDIISSLHPATTAPLAAPRRRLPTPAHTRRPNDLAARTSPSPSRYAHTNAVPSHHASPA
jgi:hypothetical protein